MPELTTAAPVEQVLNGLQVGLPGPRGHCTACGRQLHDGTAVRVYAYQQADRETWDAPRVYCRGCHPDRVRTPTLGATEAVASAFLSVTQYCASQTTRLTLSEVELQDVSPASHGARP